MPFITTGIGAAIAGGVASAAVGAGISALSAGGQSSDIAAGQQQANLVEAPYAQTGIQADTQEANLFGLNGTAAATTAMGDFSASPGYQYDLTQGLRAVDAGAASQGMLRSGATLKAEQTFGTNLANQDFQQYVTNLNGLTNFGVTAAGGVASTDTAAAGAQAALTNNAASSIAGLAGNTSVQNGLSSLFSTSNNPGVGTLASTPNPFGNTASDASNPLTYG